MYSRPLINSSKSTQDTDETKLFMFYSVFALAALAIIFKAIYDMCMRQQKKSNTYSSTLAALRRETQLTQQSQIPPQTAKATTRPQTMNGDVRFKEVENDEPTRKRHRKQTNAHVLPGTSAAKWNLMSRQDREKVVRAEKSGTKRKPGNGRI